MDLEKITQKFGRLSLQFQKQSPHIFFVAGLVGTVASTVLACRATLKLEATLDEIQEDLSHLNQVKDLVDSEEGVTYPPVSRWPNDKAYVYGKASLKLVKLYGPSVVIGGLSIAALTGSHVQLTRRNTALMAAYAAVQQAFEQYRERVREELGEEKELDLYRGVKEEKDGKEVKKVKDPNTWSPYARIFDEASPNWRKDPELNRIFINCQQRYANDLLRSRGHVFLNEVYDMLGFDRSRAGAVVGWVIGKEGDNYVSFGVYEAFNARFVNGTERSIILDFNVDGVIYDKI